MEKARADELGDACGLEPRKIVVSGLGYLCF